MAQPIGPPKLSSATLRGYPWIELVRRPQHVDRSFAGKVHAFNAGLERVSSLDFEVIGNLDADLSFDPDYMEFLLRKFAENPNLGVAGTSMREANYDALKDSFDNENDVFGACQLFRRKCFQQVGGYTPIKWGGLDWIAVRTARFNGWKTRSFCEKIFYHHRPMGATETNIWRARFDYGRKDYYLGNHPPVANLPNLFSSTKATVWRWRSRSSVWVRLLICKPDGTPGDAGIDSVPPA